MEGILLSPNYPDHQSISHKSSKNCNNNYRGGFVSRSSENFIPPSNIHGGGGGILFGSSPYMYSSSSSSLSILGHHQQQQQQQPPLLPLPVPVPVPRRIYSSFPAPRNNKLPILQSSPPPNNNTRKNKNRTRDQDLTPKKPKSSSINRVPDSRSKTIVTKSSGGTPLISSTNRLGPEPRDIPKEVSGVLKPVVVVNSSSSSEVVENEEEELSISVSGSIFSLAPPPSSLPLPKFSVTPRLRCNVEAAAAGGIDAGATDNLRRLLRLP